MAGSTACVPTPGSEALPPPPSCLCVYTPLQRECGAGSADCSVVGTREDPDLCGDRSRQPPGGPSWTRSTVSAGARTCARDRVTWRLGWWVFGSCRPWGCVCPGFARAYPPAVEQETRSLYLRVSKAPRPGRPADY